MSPHITKLLDRLHLLLAVEAAARGDTVDRLDPSRYRDVEAHAVGRSGVVAFIDHYVLAAWEPADRWAAARATYRAIEGRLARDGFTLHMVHHRNVASIIATRKLGAVFLGMDRDGYIHYRLTREAFKAATNTKHHRGHTRGKKVSSPQGA